MGDRIVVMDRGAIQQVAPPLDVYRHPSNLFVAGFIGTPPMNVLRGRVERDGGAWRFRHPDGTLAVAEAWARALAPFASHEVCMGFRPEALGGAYPCPPEAAAVRGTVDVVEPMGAETYVQMVTGNGSRVVARVGAECVLVPGSEAALPLALEQVRFFDVATGRAILDGERMANAEDWTSAWAGRNQA